MTNNALDEAPTAAELAVEEAVDVERRARAPWYQAIRLSRANASVSMTSSLGTPIRSSKSPCRQSAPISPQPSG